MPLHAPLNQVTLASPSGSPALNVQRTELRAARKQLNRAATYFLPQGQTPVYPAGHLDLERWPYTTKQRAPVDRGLRALILQEDHLCRWCRRAPATTLDHIRPLNRGGSNHPLNLVGACEQCNTIKSSFLPKELGWVLRLPPRAWQADYLERHYSGPPPDHRERDLSRLVPRGKLGGPGQPPSHGKGRK